MKEIIDFLAELSRNNNRDWFEANRDRYKQVLEQFNAIVQQLMDEAVRFDPLLSGLTLRDTTYRIYRDVRFSPNKEPYKTHMGAYLCPHGKNSGYAGYYFHLEPEASLLATGLHCPEPKVLHSVRDEIFANGDAIEKAMSSAVARGFGLDMSTSLKRLPKGFPADSPRAEWLKLKDFTLLKMIDPVQGVVEASLEDFAAAQPLNAILNRAVEYALREM